MVVVITVDTLVIREALDFVLDHWNLLLQDGQGYIGAILLEFVGQIAELISHLSISATHLNFGGLAAQMIDWVWEPRHLQGLLVPQEALEPSRQGLDLCQLLLEALGLSLHLLRIFFALSSLFVIILLFCFLALQGLLVGSSLL